jgi:hypothetical protein
MIRMTSFVVSLVFAALPICAAPLMMRQHYVVVHRDRTPAFTVTGLHDSNEARTIRTFLIADVNGPLLRLSETTDWANHRSVTQYTLLRQSHDSAKITVQMPYAATTESDVRVEIHNRPEVSSADRAVSVEGDSGKTFHGMDGDWHTSDTANARRQSMKQTISPELVEVLYGLRELAGLPPFADLNLSFGYIFDPSELIFQKTTLMVATTKADCAFDAKFGEPCSTH